MKNHEIAVELLTSLWRSLDFAEIKGKRNLTIWDEFISKVKIALNTESNIGNFCNKFCTKFETTLKPNEIFIKVKYLSQEEQTDLLNYIEENLHILIVEIRLNEEAKKNEKN